MVRVTPPLAVVSGSATPVRVMTKDTDTSTPSQTGTSTDAAQRFSWTKYGSPSAGVVEAVATVTDSEPTELQPLAHTIDPDALNALLDSHPDVDVRVAFSYAGVDVHVNGDGTGQVWL